MSRCEWEPASTDVSSTSRGTPASTASSELLVCGWSVVTGAQLAGPRLRPCVHVDVRAVLVRARLGDAPAEHVGRSQDGHQCPDHPGVEGVVARIANNDDEDDAGEEDEELGGLDGRSGLARVLELDSTAVGLRSGQCLLFRGGGILCSALYLTDETP